MGFIMWLILVYIWLNLENEIIIFDENCLNIKVYILIMID